MKQNDNPYDKMLNTAGRAARAGFGPSPGSSSGWSLRKTLSKPSLFPLWKRTQRRWEKLLRPLRLPESLRPPGTAGSIETDAESYYRAKAEQDAIHIDIAKLEADFRVGKLSKEDFAAQKSQLEAEKDALDREEDRLEDSLDLAYSQSSPSLPSGSLKLTLWPGL